MALISSSYSLPPGINGTVLPITVPPQLPYSTAGTPWMRVPLHFPGFTPASLSAAAYLTASPRARRLSDTDFHSSPFTKRLTFSPPPAHRRRRVTNFSIEGILGKQEDDEDEAEDMKVLVVDTNSEPNSPISLSISDKEDKLIGSPGEPDHPNHEVGDHPDPRTESGDNPMTRFSWLQCTRYKPPRLPRAKRKEGAKKRKLGRNPRVPFSPAQVATLEQKFRCTHYLSSIDVAELSAALNLSENRVKIWFQNRRARERRDKEAADKGDVSSSSIRPIPTSSLSLTSPTIPSLSDHIASSAASSSVFVSTTSSSMLHGLSALPRIPSSSPVDVSAFTPVAYDLKAAAAAAATAAALSSMHSHPSPS